MAGDTATFGIKLTGDTAGAHEAADALDEVRRKIDEGNERLKAMSASYRSLRGTTEEVKKAKTDLKAQENALKDSLSAQNLALLKQGTSYAALTKASKQKGLEQTAAAKKALEAEKAAEKAAKEEADQIKSAASQFPGAGALIGLLADPVTAVAAVVAGLTAALVAGGVAFTAWVIGAANARRTAGLLREAFAGSAANGEALGEQLDALAKKVPTPKAELQALSKSLIESKISGQTLVDTLNAVGQAGAAGADKLKSTIQSVLSRGVLPNGREGRAIITPADLFGSGLEFSELATSLAENMKIGVAQAQVALQQGGVKTADLAAAFRKAVEKKFGRINLAQMLDLDVLKQKAAESLSALTKDVKLDPLLEGLGKVASLLDTSTASGKALKQIVGTIGNALIDGLSRATPYVVTTFELLILYALKLELAYYETRNAILIAFRDHPELKKFADLVESVLSPTQLLDAAFGGVASKTEAMATAVTTAYSLLSKIPALAKEAWAALKAIPWQEAGEAIVDGLILGLKAKKSALIEAVKGLGEEAKDAFKENQGIHSPSTVWREYARQDVAGFVGGLEDEAPRAQAAIERVGQARPGAGGGATGGARGDLHVHLTIHVPTEAAAAGIRQDEGFMSKLLRGIEEVCVTAGVPVQPTEG